MRKDYAPLNGDDQPAGERYWTEQWDRQALAADASALVLASDEYRIARPFLDSLREAHRILKPSGLLILTVPFQNRRRLKRDGGKLWAWDPFYDRRHGYPGPMAFYQLRIVPIHKPTGAHRWLTLDRGLRRSSISYRIARALATAFLPAATIAHMLMAVARRHP